MVKNPETWVRSQGREDPLEKEIAKQKACSLIGPAIY